ncbi:uncharacterized protein LOC122034753 [Zingiber officinale]|uniref:RING-type domain-containing protein n=1 Tax=Zingiber officinale TaxID=94328 RepID=A0A8J5E9H1_ZINOF|nr:uncharacterized protein LOC122034753 [Zingiber officinale]KAG6467835.1 hypothetical protein ZIOFF_072399 [Zingiber officinale]
MCSSVGEEGATSSSKPICAICYEDLKPLAEHLQCIPVCGHVLHELCLQQWLEYCPARQKEACPICKQSCSRSRPTRLYFQSATDAAASTQTTATSSVNQQGPTAEALRVEIGRLELKLSSLTKNFATQQDNLKKLDNEVSVWKKLAKQEESKREEIKLEKDRMQQFLCVKTEELNRKSSECAKLEERSLGLAKELATLKLAMDVNLEEGEILKFASLGNGRNLENMIDVLRRSLALRNKCYKELMAQCNLLGRTENRSRLDLEKANDKIKKLKARIIELGKALEIKENDTLRVLKNSKKVKTEVHQHCVDSSAGNNTIQIGHSIAVSKEVVFPTDSYSNRSFKDCEVHDGLDSSDYNGNNWVINLDNDASMPDKHAPKYSQSESKNGAGTQKKPACLQNVSDSPSNEGYSNYKEGNICIGSPSQGISLKRIAGTDEPFKRIPVMADLEKEVLLVSDIAKQAPQEDNGMKLQAHGSFVCPGMGDQCFSGAAGGNAMTRNMVGKWCKQGLKMASSGTSGDLIAVGADGRGGRIKMLRTHNDFMGSKLNISSKKPKHKPNRTNQPQIEHFFGKSEV